jgi:hypothetical protein
LFKIFVDREALKTKQKQDKGNKPKRACPPTDEEINILYNRNVLGSHTPQSLLSTIDIGYGSYFNSFTGEQKHKKVVPEYIQAGLKSLFVGLKVYS